MQAQVVIVMGVAGSGKSTGGLAVAAALAADEPLVLACSALKAAYRARLVGGDAHRIRFVHLTGTQEMLRARMAGRAGHFMKPGMLASQLAALEPPDDAVTVDAARPVDALVADIVSRLTTA